ncbi:MAG: deoxyribose-phosphate aldolase [Aequorivita sp.]|nr:deoxyribose-phosphate aldolase [Aequorivita sp.]|tara:strand:+ start:126346 stop:127017 length:672 start_codon:yes stop_codon:yes gene_type:complete
MNLSAYIDHTLLKPTATPEDIIKLCKEAKNYNFYAVCVNSCYTILAADELRKSDVKIATVVGFPLGAANTETKICEARQAIADGSHEIDLVLNIGFLKTGLFDIVQYEIAAIKEAIDDKILKVIIETCYLTDAEIKKASQLCKAAKADYIKTSTGFGPGGATEEAVKIMLNEAGSSLKVKASGGIRDTATAQKYIDLGVSRIGTSSGVNIVNASNNEQDEHTY